MAVKIKMLKERIIPIHQIVAEIGKVYKVNNEVGLELTMAGDAEYVDVEMKTQIKKPKPESAALEPKENAMMPKSKPKTFGIYTTSDKGKSEK